jgi:hypothetical protein
MNNFSQAVISPVVTMFDKLSKDHQALQQMSCPSGNLNKANYSKLQHTTANFSLFVILLQRI